MKCYWLMGLGGLGGGGGWGGGTGGGGIVEERWSWNNGNFDMQTFNRYRLVALLFFLRSTGRPSSVFLRGLLELERKYGICE